MWAVTQLPSRHIYNLSTTYPRICIQHMDPQQTRQYQQGWGSTTSSCHVCHWRIPAHKQCHSHATATPVADTTKQTSVCPDSDDVPHGVQPCWYTSGTPPQPHLSSNQMPFTTIPGTTHKNYSVQDIIFPQAIRLWNQLPGSVVDADTLDSFKAQLSRATLMYI